MFASPARIARLLRETARNWRPLLAADLTYKLLAYVILTPLVGLLFRLFLTISGNQVLADEEIVAFFMRPLGWLTCIVVGAVAIGIVALEQVALMVVAAAGRDGVRLRARTALGFAVEHAAATICLAARIVGIVLLVVAPFLIIAGVTYTTLLTEFDINYYLQERPPAFLLAVGIGVVLGAALVCVVVQLASGWFVSLPMVVFENASWRTALRESQARLKGSRLQVGADVVAWAAATAVSSALLTSAVGLLGRTLLLGTTDSLELLVVVSGSMLLLANLVNLLVSFFSSAVLAGLLVDVHAQHRQQETAINWGEIQQQEPRLRLLRSRWGLVAVGVIAMLVSTFIGVATFNSIPEKDDTTITAHRGASAFAPENTLAAIRRAIEDGADYVEIDVQESRDGTVVVIHDSDLKKIGGSDLRVWESDAADLQAVDIGSWFDPEFAAERIPTLAEVLALVKGKARLAIELKHYGYAQQLEQRVVDLVEAAGMEEDVVVMSLKLNSARKVKELRPEWSVGLLTAVALGDLSRVNVDFLAVNTSLATRSFVQRVHDNDKRVAVWTVNDALTMSAMMSKGVDSIITDDPALGKSVLLQREDLGIIERFLIEVAGLAGVAPQTRDAQP